MIIQISKPLCFSAIGQKPNQEDALFPPQGEATAASRVFMVCDGMGGHEHGEVASACVAETIGRFTANQPLTTTAEMKKAFEQGLQQAYDHLDELDKGKTERKMGTTLTFLAICSDGVLVAHIGDSRVYQLRPGEGVVFQTRDHSLVNELIAAGELNEAEAKTFPQRNVITRAVQPHQDYPAKAAFNVLADIRKGDLFFLCCDGVLEQLDNGDLTDILLDCKPVEERLAAVEKACMERGTRDNNTAYLIEVAELEQADQPQPTIVGPKAEVEPSPTATAASEQDQKPKNKTTTQPHGPHPHKYTLLTAGAIVIILAILAYFFLSPASEPTISEQANKTKVEKGKRKTTTDTVQGTIQRTKE